MNRYEGMYIFSERVKTDDLDAATNKVREVIEAAGGEIESATRIGKRTFARPLQKQEAGQYAVITFRIGGEKLDDLKARYKLSEEVLRVQFIRLEDEAAPAVAAEEKANG